MIFRCNNGIARTTIWVYDGLAVIGATFSHYRVIGEIGKGGMGNVYLAEDTTLGRRVAIKFPKAGDDGNYRARFLDEARAASKLQHPNIAQIFDFGETPDGRQFLVMELVAGEDLHHTLRRGPLPPARAVEIAAGLLSALEEAHRNQLVHRDIKPSNVMIAGRGAVKVLDFGLAKQIPNPASPLDTQQETLPMGLTRPGVAVGTPMYMAPEQARGLAVDARTDIFSAGLVLYECLTGKPAFPGATQADILAKVLYERPPPPSSVSKAVSRDLDRIVMKAIEKDAAARYQSAAEFSADLNRAHRTPVRSSAVTAAIARTTALLLSKPRRAAALAVGLVTALALVSLAFLPLERRPSEEAGRWYSEGLNALRDGTYHRASKAFERTVALDAKFALGHARLAEAWSELEYSDKAKEEMLRAQMESGRRSWFDTPGSLYTEAISRTLTRDFKGAIERYLKIAAGAPDGGKAQAHVDLGRAYEKNDEIQKALESYEVAAKRNPQYATAFLRRGILYGRLQKTEDAEKNFREADSLYAALSNLEGQTEVLFQRGFLASKARKLDEARENLDRALGLAQTTGSEYQQTAALLQLSVVAQLEGNTALAETRAAEGIELARKAGIASLESRGLIDSGNAFLVRRDYSGAESRFRQALDVARRSAMRRQEARASFSLGSVHIQQRKPDEGLVEVEAARAFFERGGYRQETGLCLSLIARVNQQKGEFDAALKDFQALLRLAEEAKDGPTKYLAQSGRAGVLLNRESYPDAVKAWEMALETARALRNSGAVFSGLANYANVLWRIGRNADARRALSEAEALAKMPGAQSSQLWSVTRGLADMAVSEGRYPDALRLCQEALRLAGDQPVSVSPSKAALGLVLAHTGARREARVFVQGAAAIAPSSDPGFVAGVRLTMAEAQFLSGDLDDAAKSAGALFETFKRLHQVESAFRAASIAAIAAERKGDARRAEDFKLRASAILTEIEGTWPRKDFQGYLARPDIQNLTKHMRRIQ